MRAADEETIRSRIPMKLKKRAGRKEIVVPRGVTGAVLAQEALLRAVARAFRWQTMLVSGEVKSISGLASRFHVDRSYVARTLRLASLAPAIVEVVLAARNQTASRSGSWQQASQSAGMSNNRTSMANCRSEPAGTSLLWHRNGTGAIVT